ncbi:hypothetical protein QZH41_007772 [Actinostola sp. cb2023]|nr:hypothetical protein QZH41_007772 [Actinostola sp. cb2023]
MFDTIQRSVTLSSDWATLLFQLVSSGTITAESLPSKKELLTNVLDMVSVLISVVTNTEATTGPATDETRKAAITLFKKLKGLKINGKQKISAWDLMEGHKNPAPFAWAWFGAVRIERRPSRYEQEFRKLLHHTHIPRKPSSYFINPHPDDDVDDDEDEKMDADEGGDKSSMPSTPQTPAEAKGLWNV